MTTRAAILGAGHYLPEKIVTNADIVAMGLDTSDDWIVERTGIRQRHIASETETVTMMGAAAAKFAIADAGLECHDIDQIIVATTTPDHPGFPSAACEIQHVLGLGPCGAFDVAAACSGFVYAMQLANQAVLTGQSRHTLVVAADRLSHYVDWTDRGICVLFGDGAGACVVGPSPSEHGIIATRCYADGAQGPILKMDPMATQSNPQIYMEGRAVFKTAVNHIVPSVRAIVEDNQYKVSDVDWFVPHQANLRIMDPARQKLGIAPDKMLVNVDRCGNTSAASIPIALSEAASQFNSGDMLAMIGFGAGFTWATGLITWR